MLTINAAYEGSDENPHGRLSSFARVMPIKPPANDCVCPTFSANVASKILARMLLESLEFLVCWIATVCYFLLDHRPIDPLEIYTILI